MTTNLVNYRKTLLGHNIIVALRDQVLCEGFSLRSVHNCTQWFHLLGSSNHTCIYIVCF